MSSERVEIAQSRAGVLISQILVLFTETFKNAIKYRVAIFMGV